MSFWTCGHIDVHQSAPPPVRPKHRSFPSRARDVMKNKHRHLPGPGPLAAHLPKTTTQKPLPAPIPSFFFNKEKFIAGWVHL